jgi:hypothetical protein
LLWIKVYITQYSDFQLFLVWTFSYLFVFSSIERWVLNSFDFYLLSYKIIDMYIQRLNFLFFACIYLLFRLVTKSPVNSIWRHLCLIKTCAIPGRIGNSWWPILEKSFKFAGVLTSRVKQLWKIMSRRKDKSICEWQQRLFECVIF